MAKRICTQHYSGALDADYSSSLYIYFKENMKWIDGVKSKNGFTRKASPMNFGSDKVLDEVITKALVYITKKENLEKKQIDIHGIYLNWYRDGNDYTPNHSHPGMKQIIISLGATRTLKVGNKEYDSANGDIIVFGSSIHGVPKEPEVTEGRISIALFTKDTVTDE
jgi:hypothetical protein